MFDLAWKFLPDRGCHLNLEIREGSFPFWASARVVEPRRSNDEAQHKWGHGAQSDSTRGYVTRTRKEWGGVRYGAGRVLGGGAGGRHSDKGEGCNTLYYGYANHLH
jgi:hypothetical protein